jgi:hypothetical protein
VNAATLLTALGLESGNLDAQFGPLADWVNGGRLDLILDAIQVRTTLALPAVAAGAALGLPLLSAVGNLAIGTGSKLVQLTCETTLGVPINGVQVMISTNVTGANMIRGPLWSDDNGIASGVLLNPGTYYAWRSKAGVSFPNPQAFVVDA